MTVPLVKLYMTIHVRLTDAQALSFRLAPTPKRMAVLATKKRALTDRKRRISDRQAESMSLGRG